MCNKPAIIFLGTVFFFISCTHSKNRDKVAHKEEKTTKNTLTAPIYLGTYTKKEAHVNGKAEGIYLANQEKNGFLTLIKTVAKITNPSFVKVSIDGKNLYSVSELSKTDTGFIYSFKINDDYSLKQLNKLSTEGFAPCQINFDKTDQYVFVANFFGGVVMQYKKDTNGRLINFKKLEINKINPEDNSGDAHPHAVDFSNNNQYMYITDLGNDKIWIFNFDENTGKFTPGQQPFVKLVKGSAPRHLAFSLDNKHAYGITELNNTVNVFDFSGSTGGLNIIQIISSLPNNFQGTSYASEIAIHPNGKFLYTSNRGHNSIAAFKIDEPSGKLELIEFTNTGGDFPRNFNIDPSGNFLYAANQNSDNIVYFKINKTTGKPVKMEKETKVMTPVWIEFVKK